MNRSGTETAFDSHAAGYDQEFSDTATGRYQRELVWRFLRKQINPGTPLRILEINCGTGVDAAWLQQQGFEVTATDLSAEMLAVAAGKNKKVTFVQCNFLELDKHFAPGTFDVIFSNFGGLNCVDEKGLQQISNVASGLLRENGKFIAVVMGNNCWWEKFYFRRKGKHAEAARRASGKPVEANINGNRFPVWYYSPVSFASCFQTHFKVTNKRAIGWLVPPSYLDNAFKNKRFLLQLFFALDKWCGKFSFAINRADHFLIAMDCIIILPQRHKDTKSH